MPLSKGKQISVIIAGATGSTGCELVSRLVSHPDITRVVALSRSPLPINRWSSVFPNLNTGDAMRYLSVIPIDWMRVLADAANIPTSYVVNGEWELEEELQERHRYMKAMKRLQSYQHHRSRLDARLHPSGASRHDFILFPRAGERPLGYVHYTPLLRGGEVVGAGVDGTSPKREELLDSQIFLQHMLRTDFYRSVFTGHHVAINCMGTSQMLRSRSTITVDHDISIAFAKLVRLFNSMVHAESSEEEERILVESTSKELDSVLWDEIYTACYGNPGSEEDVGTPTSTSSHPLDQHDAPSSLKQVRKNSKSHAAFRGQTSVVGEAEQMNRGGVGTLLHFTQISTRSASEHSPIPYLRAHARRDRALIRLFSPDVHHHHRHHHSTSFRPRWWSPASWWRAAMGAHPQARLGRLQLHPTGADSDSVARGRAELLLRRDIVMVWGGCNLTIWQPGLLLRHERRLWEWCLSLFYSPTDVRQLAECIVDEIIDSMYDREDGGASVMAACSDANSSSVQVLNHPTTLGHIKIINGRSVARRVHMKSIEDGLDHDDLQQPK